MKGLLLNPPITPMPVPQLSETKKTNNGIYLFKWKLKKISVIIIFQDNIHFLPSTSSSSSSSSSIIVITITIMVITIINLHLILLLNRHDHRHHHHHYILLSAGFFAPSAQSYQQLLIKVILFFAGCLSHG